jgi:hypothetical protein
MTASTPTTAIATYIPQEQDRGDLLWDPAAYAHAIGVATALSKSGLLPEHFKDKPASVLIALAMARRLREDPFVVLQSVHVIHGKPGFSAQYVIARANLSGVFSTPIQFEETGKGDELAVRAYATLASTNTVVEFTVSMEMAKAEGWATRAGNKYKTMPGLMLRYRAATFLVRLFAPQVMLGMQTAEELRDTGGRDFVDADDLRRVDQSPVTVLPDVPSEPPRGMAAVDAALGEEAPGDGAIYGGARPPGDGERITTPTPTPTSGPGAYPDNATATPAPNPAEAVARQRLMKEIAEIAKVLPQEVRDRLKKEHGLTRIMPNADIGKLGALVLACQAEVARLKAEVDARRAPDTEREPDSEADQKVIAEIGDFELALDGQAEKFAEAVRASGAPTMNEGAEVDIDACDSNDLRAYRDALKARAGGAA